MSPEQVLGPVPPDGGGQEPYSVEGNRPLWRGTVLCGGEPSSVEGVLSRHPIDPISPPHRQGVHRQSSAVGQTPMESYLIFNLILPLKKFFLSSVSAFQI